MSNEKKSRLKREYGKFQKQEEFIACIPDRSKIDQWHITLKGMPDTPFEGGFYHFLLDLTKYPEGPPDVVALNENGGFEVGKQLCIRNFSTHHRAEWHENFEVLQMCTVIQSVLCLRADEDERKAISNGSGFLPIDPDKAKILAEKSKDFVCQECKKRLGDYKFKY